MMRTWGVVLLFAAALASAAETPRAVSLIQQNCVKCHPASKIIASGKIVEMISGAKPKMPMGAKPLAAADVEEISKWVASGAKWVDEKWWSLRPLPARADASKSVDFFVDAKLREKGLHGVAEADRRTLIRRLTYDLHGLPPSWSEVQAFVGDARPDAYERLVDRLLASPRYGERWGRHWLDVAHYGESHGFDKDKPRRNAWHYRDWVIRAFNEDKPYPAFVAEQLAGDLLKPGDPDGIIATGFISAGPWDFVGHVELREGTTDKNITRLLDRDDMVTQTISAFTSTTAHCARCHNHKFDPIPQTDYYRLQAVFAGVDRGDRMYDVGPGGALFTYAAKPLAKPRDIFVLARGSVDAPGEAVHAGGLTMAGVKFDESVDPRVALAKWITDPGNVLAWRSIVNRVWHYHFGAGIVDSPNDFGRMGSEPTNGELLDWLAATFRDNGGSFKSLHKMIVMSAAYRRASAVDAANAAIDADNRFLWRMNRTRLDAESIRDAVLAVSGKLDLTMGGPAAEQFWFKDDHSPVYDYTRFDIDSPASYRRSVYRFLVRSVPDPLMDRLDCPDTSLVTAKRNVTLTAIQALALMNNPFIVRQAEWLAKDADIPEMFRRSLSREPQADELRELEAYEKKFGRANMARVILNSNEFLFVD